MVVNVTDARSSPSDQIAHAVKVLGRSKDRLAIFKAIYHGKQQAKTVENIHKMTGLARKRILEEAIKLAKNQIVHQSKKDGDTAYVKDSFYAAQKIKILALVKDPKQLARFPTKTTPRPIGSSTITIQIPQQRVRARLITIDEIDSFSKVRKNYDNADKTFKPILETKFKEGIKRILGEQGRFKDWGGERNDLLTTRLKIKSRRRATAFAFKGRGKRGKLTPASMGKNGDQIQRLFLSPVEVFIVQYWGQIDESVLEQMGEFAKAKSVAEAKEILYGIIDGHDTKRIIDTYPEAFRRKG
jgi:hypothetical protein